MKSKIAICIMALCCLITHSCNGSEPITKDNLIGTYYRCTDDQGNDNLPTGSACLIVELLSNNEAKLLEFWNGEYRNKSKGSGGFTWSFYNADGKNTLVLTEYSINSSGQRKNNGTVSFEVVQENNNLVLICNGEGGMGVGSKWWLKK